MKKKYTYHDIEIKEFDSIFENDDVKLADGVLLKAYALIPSSGDGGGCFSGSDGIGSDSGPAPC